MGNFAVGRALLSPALLITIFSRLSGKMTCSFPFLFFIMFLAGSSQNIKYLEHIFILFYFQHK